MEERRRENLAALIRLETEVDNIQKAIQDQKEFTQNSINDIKNCLKEMKDDVKKLIPKVAKLEVKAGVWGGISGLIAGLIIAALSFLRKY